MARTCFRLLLKACCRNEACASGVRLLSVAPTRVRSLERRVRSQRHLPSAERSSSAECKIRRLCCRLKGSK